MAAALQRVEFADYFDGSFEELETSRAKALRTLGEALRGFPKDADPSKFAPLLDRSQTILELDDSQLSLLLNVARPTIGRWRRGVSAPHPLMRKAIFDVLSRTADTKLRHHHGRIS